MPRTCRKKPPQKDASAPCRTGPHRRTKPHHCPLFASGTWPASELPGRGDGPFRPSPGGTLPVQTGAQGRHHLGHVPDQIILDFTVIHDQDAATPGRQRGFDVLEPEPAEPLPLFDYDRAHRGVADGPAQLPPVAVQTGPDFLDDLIGAAIMLSGPLGQPAGLAVEVAALVRGGDAGVQNAPRTGPREAR